MLTREMILGAEDRKPVPVNVPEWGGQVFVRTMSGSETIQYQTRFVGQDEANPQVMAGLVALTACDETGKLLFSLDDVAQLSSKSGVALARVWNASRKLNLVTDADVETLAGKSEAAPA
jgi:hypothetical protein